MENNPTFWLVVAAAIRTQSGAWLVQRRPDHKVHGGLWEFPGGKVDPGETPEKALVRELAEELSITVEPAACQPAAFAQSPPNDGQPGIVLLLYTVTRFTGTPKPDEGARIAFVMPEELDALPKPRLDADLWAALKSLSAN